MPYLYLYVLLTR